MAVASIMEAEQNVFEVFTNDAPAKTAIIYFEKSVHA